MPSSPELLTRSWQPWEPEQHSEHKPAWQPADPGAPTTRSTDRPADQPAWQPAWQPANTDDGALGSTFAVSTKVGVPEQLLADAREQARREGFDAGWLDGRQQGVEAERAIREQHAQDLVARRTEAAREMDRTIAALDLAAAHVSASTAEIMARVEQLVVDAAMDLAEAVVGHSVRTDPDRGLNAVRRAFTLVPAESEQVRVAVHPDDLAVLNDVAPGMVPASVTLVADASLAPGDAIAIAGATTVDARIAGALARVREALS